MKLPISIAAGNIPVAMMSLTAAPASLVSAKAARSVRMHLGALDDAKGDLGGNAERAFIANETASQVVAQGVKMLPLVLG